MRALIPYFIQERFKEKKRIGNLKAYTMFIDLSGFTAMTESLMQQGNVGAEILSGLLNQIFEPLVKIVYEQNGFIPYFAGDAFMAVFPEDESLLNADTFIRLAIKIRDFFNEDNIKSDFSIKAKIGLSFGEVEWGIVGDHPNSFYFRGVAVDSSAKCQLKAQAQEIILDTTLHNKVRAESNGFWKLAPLDNTWFIVENQGSPFIPLSKDNIVQQIDGTIAKNFLPNSIIDFDQSGEFRDVITLFIAFDGVQTHDSLDKLATITLAHTKSFSGYFKEIDFSDKGGVMVVIFGAPVSYENNAQRALEFALNLLEDVEKLPNTRLKIGITSGTAYTGIIGGKERCQYAAVGSYVNLSARLMAKASWGNIFCDQNMSRNKAFRFSYEGNIAYKGVSQDIPTYLLLGRKADEELIYQNAMIGRQAELEELILATQPLIEGSFAGVMYIYGEAGIGKSRLTFELKKDLQEKGISDWLVCQADQILKKPFNPFIYCLKNYFDQSLDRPIKENRLNFESNFDTLLKVCSENSHSQAENISKELLRTKSIIGGLLGHGEQNSLWEQLDAKGRYDNTFAALSNFFAAEAILNPLVIALEDAHWFDDDSKRFLQDFIKNISALPVFILVTSRYNDDNSKVDIFEKNKTFNIKQIDLNTLQPEALQLMTETRFGGKVDDNFLAFLQRSSNGNPFYAEQILEYFLESKLLEKTNDGVWIVKDKSLKLGGSINTVLTARVDRLSYLVKETVKAAAVIGREFELPILSEVMKTQEEFIRRNGNQHLLLKEQVQTAEKSQIWQAINELRYIFKHSLLREAIYDMQLRARLRELHKSIAVAIEKLYDEHIEERFADLAFHYEQAEIASKTIEYINKAADFARRNYQNSQALEYYEKLLSAYFSELSSEEIFKIFIKKGEVLQLMGEWNKAEGDFQKALSIAAELDDKTNIARANGLIGNVLMLKGEYGNARKHHEIGLNLAEELDDAIGISRSLGGLGNLYFRQGDYERSESFFNQCLSEVKKIDEKYINPQIVANLGLTYMNQSRYQEGIDCMLEQLQICEKKKDKLGTATLHTNLGIVYFEQGNNDEAQHHFQEGLATSEALGNQLLISIALGSLGSVYEKKGELDIAQGLYTRDLELTQQLGDKQGIAIAMGLMGSLYVAKKDYENALVYLEKNLVLCESLNYQKGIIKAYNLLGDLYLGKKEYHLSEKNYLLSMEAAKKINSKLLYGLSAIELAIVYLRIKQIEKAQVLKNEVAEIVINHTNLQLLKEFATLEEQIKNYF